MASGPRLERRMVIAPLNITASLDETQAMIRRLEIHIFALNETKWGDYISFELTNIPGYQQKRLDRTCKLVDVFVYTRESIKFRPIDDVPLDGLSSFA